jgi:hypothetical protein
MSAIAQRELSWKQSFGRDRRRCRWPPVPRRLAGRCTNILFNASGAGFIDPFLPKPHCRGRQAVHRRELDRIGVGAASVGVVVSRSTATRTAPRSNRATRQRQQHDSRNQVDGMPARATGCTPRCSPTVSSATCSTATRDVRYRGRIPQWASSTSRRHFSNSAWTARYLLEPVSSEYLPQVVITFGIG